MIPRLRPGALAVLAILLLPVLVRLPFWAAGLRDSPIWAASALTLPGAGPLAPGLPGFLDLNAGWTTQALGGLAARLWMAGQVPWWDPYTGIGMPLAAEMQSSALFLPYILLLLLPGGMTLLGLALQWTGGLATWRFLLRAGLGPPAAVTGALCFQLCACFSWLGPPASLPVAFLPLFLLGLERARAAALAGTGAGWRTTAAAVALSLYAGFPETAYLDGLFALLWTVLRGLALPGARLRFAVRVAAGGIVGLLLVAPLLGPFLAYLPNASMGLRDGMDMGRLSIPLPGAALLLTPYAFGLQAGLSSQDPSGLLVHLWGRAGGYLGMALALAAVIGALAPGRDRVLRLVLLGWIALFLARLSGVPGAAAIFRVVPFQDQMQVFRYAEAAWQMPSCILAAYALDVAWQPRRIQATGAVLLAASLTAGWAAWPLVRQVPDAPAWLAGSLAWGAVSLLAAVLAFAQPRRAVRAAVLIADMALLAAMPLLSGHRNPTLDWPAIQFLQDNIGLQRVATLGPMQPNYGALFGIASVNHNYLPSPAAWADWVQANLRPGADPVLFTGNFPPDQPGQPTNAEFLAGRLRAYAGLGVRYVLAPAGPSPFDPAPPGAVLGPTTALTLESGQPLSGRAMVEPGTVAGAAVRVGTFAGQSSGLLELELCGVGACGRGQVRLDGVADNAPLAVRLSQPVATDGRLDWTLRHLGGHPVAVWHHAGADGPVPDLAMHFRAPMAGPVLAYSDAILSIYEVPDPAPYLSAEGGACTVAPRSRTALTAQCSGPATLVRRELMMPGWHARVNGEVVEVARAGPLFQAVALPDGSSRVSFDYSPPGLPAFAALFALGTAGLLPWHRLWPWAQGMILRRGTATAARPG